MALVVAVSTVAPVGATVAPTPTPAVVDGLSVQSTTTYTLDPDAQRVHVRSDITLTNTSPPAHLAYGTRHYYFDRFAVFAVGPVANVRATRDGVGLAVDVEDAGPGVDAMVVHLSPTLTYGAPQHIVVEYDLPGQPGGSASMTRVNSAFATWYVAAIDSSTTGTVVVDVPERFELEAVTDVDATTETSNGRTVTRFDGLDEDSGSFGVSARDDDELIVRTIEIDDDSFDVQAWPGDDAWAEFAADTVTRGVPALTEFIGLDLEGRRSIDVAESGTPYLYGFAGWYSPSDDRIEVGDEHDRHTMLHELAHLWYHDELFSSRWVIEGLAELAAAHTIGDFDDDPIPIVALDPNRPGIRLDDWDHTGLGEMSGEDDQHGYETSYAVIDALHELLGADRFRAVVARAAAGELPLSGENDGMRPPLDDWRYFYDLLVTTEGVDGAAVDALFTTYVLPDSDLALLPARRTAMADFRELDDVDGDWSPPLVLRRALAAWNFDAVPAIRAAAERIVDKSADVADVLAPHGVGIDAIASAYERARSIGDLADLEDELAGFRDAAAELAALESDVSSMGPLQRLGNLGRDVAGRAAAAGEAFESGDLDEMQSIIEDTEATMAQWPIVLLAWAGVVGGAAALIVLVSRRVARSRG